MEESEEPAKTESQRMLQKLVGNWKGNTKTWFEPGKLADESETTASFKKVLGGSFVMCEYSGSLLGDKLEGIVLFGYNLPFERYESAWIDTAHMGTGIMYSQGEDDDDQFSVVGHYSMAPGQDEWGWRTEINIVDADHMVITAYNITPGGEEAKAVEHDFVKQ